MFSSCLENIEPEGIKDLRGAKAELLRAKTALEEANAAKVNAEAAFVQAQAKIQEAIAKQEEAKAAYEAAVARLKELEVEKQTALDQIEIEKAIAEAQAAIAEAQAQAAIYAAELQRDLLAIQAEIAENQAALEVALKDLAIAKNTLTADQLDAIAGLELAVEAARDDVEAKTLALENAASDLAVVLAELDSPKALALVTKMAELEILRAQSELEAYKVAEAKAKALLELDPEVTDWDAQVEAIEAELYALQLEVAKHAAEKSEATAVLSDSLEIVEALAAEYTAYTGYELLETGYFSKVKGVPADPTVEIPGEIAVLSPVDADGNSLFGDFIVDPAEYNYGEEDEFIKKFEDKVKALNKLNAKSYETYIANYEGVIEAYKEDPYNKYVLAKYNDAVAAYTAGDVLPYFNKYVFPYDGTLPEDFDLTVAVKEYNDALAAMEKAVAQFNSEYDKYNPDFNAEYEAAYVAKTKAYSAAEIAQAKAYQKAEDDTKYTYNTNFVLPAAEGAWTAAQNAYTIAVAEAETAGTADQATMTAFVEAYDASTATEPEKDLYAAYTAALKLIADAGKVKTAAEAEYNKAVEAYGKVKDAYDKAIAKADADYGVAKDKADADYDKAYAAIVAKTPTFDPAYSNNLVAQVEAAETELQDAVELISDVNGYFGSFNSYYVKFELNSGAVYTIYGIPEFMVDITVGNDGVRVFAMKSAAVADFVDKEYFKDELIADMYESLTLIRATYYVYNSSNPSEEEYITTLAWGVDTENAPLELPTFEEYKEVWQNINSVPDWVYNVANSIANSEGWTVYGLNRSYTRPFTYYADYIYADYIAKNEEAIANLALIPDFVKAIEAAQAEVEAFMAEKTAEVEEMKAVVEAFMPKVNKLMESIVSQLEVLEAKADVLEGQYNILKALIESYTDGYETVAEFTKALEEAYYDAVEDTYMAEGAVIMAEKDLADLKAGVASYAEWAQRAYDRAAEELAVAISKLEKATAALENIIAAIYETGEVPETPDTPDVPAGDDTTDEGGEAEGGEGA